jgi:hypothetical protein
MAIIVPLQARAQLVTTTTTTITTTTVHCNRVCFIKLVFQTKDAAHHAAMELEQSVMFQRLSLPYFSCRFSSLDIDFTIAS